MQSSQSQINRLVVSEADAKSILDNKANSVTPKDVDDMINIICFRYLVNIAAYIPDELSKNNTLNNTFKPFFLQILRIMLIETCGNMILR